MKHDIITRRFAVFFAALFFALTCVGGCKKPAVVNSVNNTPPTPSQSDKSSTRPPAAATPQVMAPVLNLSPKTKLFYFDTRLTSPNYFGNVPTDSLIVYKDAKGYEMAEYIVLVPIRAVAEGLGKTVWWNSQTRAIFIDKKRVPSPVVLSDWRSFYEVERAEVLFNGTIDVQRFGKDGIVYVTVEGASTR